MNYVDYTISYRDIRYNPRDITGLTYNEAQKQAKNLIKTGVVWLEVYKITHNYEKVYDYSDYKNRPSNINEIIRNKSDLEESKLPESVKNQLNILFNN